MKFHSESRIAHGRDKVYTAYRDRLRDFATRIDDIEAVNVLSREEQGDVTRVHNEWVSDREIPSVARKFLKPEHLRWDDFAEWNDGEHKVRFEIKTRVFPDAVKCVGTNTFIEDGDGTRVVLEGDFQVDLKKVSGIPRFLRSTIVPQVEKFIVSLITPNLTNTNTALGDFLDAEG